MAEHVTLFHMKAQAGKRQAAIDQFAKWEREHKGAAKGYLSSIVVTNNEDPDELLTVVRFDSTENYNANSNRPEQGAWFAELRALLVADPEWVNGTLAGEGRA